MYWWMDAQADRDTDYVNIRVPKVVTNLILNLSLKFVDIEIHQLQIHHPRIVLEWHEAKISVDSFK